MEKWSCQKELPSKGDSKRCGHVPSRTATRRLPAPAAAPPAHATILANEHGAENPKPTRHQTKNANRKMKLSIGALSLALTSSSSTAAAAAVERELQLPPSVMCLGGGGSIESCCADADASDALCPALICTDFDTISIKDGCQCSSLGNLCANAVLTGVLNTVAPGEV